jgi:biliverdin reductase
MYPIRVGFVGTGYAAKARAETLQSDRRAKLVAVAGHRLEAAQEFGAPYGAEATASWVELVTRSDVDLIIVATINSEHGAVVQAALEAGKHVVVEYPLSIDFNEAQALVTLAQQHNKLLHVEHIELLSSVHQTVKATLPTIGNSFYVRYTSLNGQHPAPRKWTYVPSQFGFPLIGAVSRLHRLTNLFGRVTSVSCQNQYWYEANSPSRSNNSTSEPSHYIACLCTAQFRFSSGLIADLVYGKGETIWQNGRSLEIHAEQGGIFVDGEQGTLVQANQTQALSIGGRRGLFAQDTARVLDYLTVDTPLYVSLSESLYALEIADAARRSAETGQTIYLTSQ